MEDIKYSPNSGIGIGNLKDEVPERMIKVYPYEMPNTSKSEEFIGAQTSSIVYITQDQLDVNNEFLLTDDNGNKYFSVFASITSEGKLDYSSSTSTLGQELKEEDSFTALSNWYYEGELEAIKIGNMRFMPAVFTVGKPFNKGEYETGEQSIYLSTSMIEAKEGRASQINVELNHEGLYEFNMGNITLLESQFTNAKLYFTTYNTSSNDIITYDNSRSGVTLGFENHTLINYVKGKGKTNEFSSIGTDEGIEFGEVDFVSKEPLAPVMMTPISTQDKTVMYASWFDYDVCLPFVSAEPFRTANTLNKIITQTEDLKLVEDMLVVSAAFAESFLSVKVLASGGDAGKLDPTFRIGWKGIKVSSISGKNPVEVVDGLFEDHIRVYPTFLEDPARYQPVKQVLAALSRYIYSSYAIGKGQNSFNSIYLPWYLSPVGALSFNRKHSMVNPDKGQTGNVDTYLLGTKDENDSTPFYTTKFLIKSNYFRSTYSILDDLKPTNELVIPPTINLSNEKMIQTDRKLTLPQLPYTISSINKLPLPGDMDTKSSNDLQYIWYLPIQGYKADDGTVLTAQNVMEEFYINKEKPHSSTKPGERVTVNLDPTADGTLWDQAQANAAVKLQQPGDIKVFPIVSTAYRIPQGEAVTITNSKHDVNWKGSKIFNGFLLGANQEITDTELKDAIFKLGLYADINAIEVVSNTLKRGDGFNFGVGGGAVVRIAHSEFKAAVVLSSGEAVQTYSQEKRQTLFDKQQWKRFMTKFKITPNKIIDYELLEKNDFKITRLDEIIIGSCWGNFVEVKVGGILISKIELFNSTDETIGVQRIIFT